MSLLEKLFGCKHKRFSFPQTRRIGGRRAGIYIVCLECGKEFEYDFEQMKIKEGTKWLKRKPSALSA